MSRQWLTLALRSLLFVLVTFFGIVINRVLGAAEGTTSASHLFQYWPSLGLGLTAVALAIVWLSLHRLEHPPSPRPSWHSDRSPYPGLEAFTEEYAGVFFGRQSEIAEMYLWLTPAVPAQASRVVSVVGPSGVGKSSLVQAGLLPQLARRGRWLVVPPMVPEDQPIRNLARSLVAAGQGESAEELAVTLTEDSGILLKCVEELCVKYGGRPASVLLVIDQAEELLTLTGETERRRFLSMMQSTQIRDRRLWIVIVLRSEFLTGFLTTEFSSLITKPITVGALPQQALFDVIEKPAACAGLELEPGLAERLVNDTGRGDALPLLAYALHELYELLIPAKRLTIEAYDRVGGVAGALTRRADQVAVELRSADADTPIISTLLKFVAVTNGEPTRRRVRRRTLTVSERRVTEAFVAARLLVSDAEGDDVVLDVAHEALFYQWEPLREAIKAATEDLQWRADLERWALDWERSGHHNSYLLRDERLRAAEVWAARHGGVAEESMLVAEFLDRSRRNDQAAMRWLSETLAERALAALDSDPEQGLLLAVTALEEVADTPLARRALINALASSRLCVPLRGHTAILERVVWSPDGRRLATVSYDGTARVWDATNGTELLALNGNHGPLHSTAWSPDGHKLVTACHDATARVWDATNGAELLILRGHTEHIRGVAWSPDGRQVATASNDGTARIWDSEDGNELFVLNGDGQIGWVHAISFSPSGHQLAIAGQDRTVRLWNCTDGTELLVLSGHDAIIRTVVWSPDGRYLASAAYDNTARVWDVIDGKQARVLRGHSDFVQSVAWSPDQKRLATASSDRTARIWDAHRGTELLVLQGHSSIVRDVAWSPDGQKLATASNDHTGRIWNVTSQEDVRVLRGHEGSIQAITWSRDGTRLATASADRTARVWDVAYGTELILIQGHSDPLRAIAWAPNNERLATGANDGTVRIWDASDGSLILDLSGTHPYFLDSIAWSPDGERLAIGSEDRTVRVLRASDGAELGRLIGHTERVIDVAWSPDGRLIATASADFTARIWHPMVGTETSVFRGHTDFVQAVAWSPDATQLATTSNDRTIRVWQASDGTELAILIGHNGKVSDVAWSPDGQLIATASDDGTARIWDPGGTELLALGIHAGAVEALSWSPNGRYIATASRDQTSRIWEVTTDLQLLIARARSRIFHDLTEEERRNLGLLDRPPDHS
jgi:WD40 repeat protein